MPSEKQSSETKHLTGPVIIDLETNGLLKNTTEIHCIAVHYVDEGMTLTYNDTGAAEPIVRAVQFIEQAERIISWYKLSRYRSKEIILQYRSNLKKESALRVAKALGR